MMVIMNHQIASGLYGLKTVGREVFTGGVTMKRTIDLSQLSRNELLAIKSVLTGGALATADSKEVKRLKAENERLKREKKIRAIVESYDLDYDSDPDYWMELEKCGALEFACSKLSKAMKSAQAEAKPRVMKIPQMISTVELNDVDALREGLQERKNGNGRKDV